MDRVHPNSNRASERSSATRKTLFGRILAVAASTLGALALAEVGYRAWCAVDGRAHDRAALEGRLEYGLDRMAAFVPGADTASPERESALMLHPYRGAVRGHDPGGVLAYFRKGVPADTYTVVVLGGSVAASWSGHPLFAQLLEGDPRFEGKDVEVLRYAHAAYKQPQQLIQLAYLLSFGYRPDAVINLDGFNEVANGYNYSRAGVNPLYPSFPVWGGVLRLQLADERSLELSLRLTAERERAERLVSGAIDRGWTRSALLGRYVEQRLAEINRTRSSLQRELLAVDSDARTGGDADRQVLGPEFEPGLESVVELAATSWFQSSLSMHTLCEARGIFYLHCLQPTKHDPGSKPLTQEERDLDPGPVGWKPGVEAGYPLLRAKGRELAELGIHFVDTSRCFADSPVTLYSDACHLVRKGNATLTLAIATAFFERMPGKPR